MKQDTQFYVWDMMIINLVLEHINLLIVGELIGEKMDIAG